VKRPAPPPRSERELVGVVARYLEERGYRVRRDPDGTDYFDLVARRGDEVGLVEVKVRDARSVLAQALRRRGWGAWTAVALGSARAARHLAERTAATRAAPVGIWIVDRERIEVVREARPWAVPGAADPFVELREQFRRWLDLVESLGPGSPVVWDGIPSAVRRASGGRSFSEWRLDETADTPP
jgi:hypothetical protein